MPSEQRLHPASIAFDLVRHLRAFVLPGLFVLFGARSAGWDWQIWGMLFLIPYSGVSVVRYLTYRYRYEESELVVRSGLLSRNERHIPYARIQNLDAVQNVLHRLLGVVEVRVQTGGGTEPEATMRVLPFADYEEMRRRVFAERREAVAAAAAPATDAFAEGTAAAGQGARTLLRLSPRELLLFGFVQNRGAIVLAAAFGLLWELGLVDRLTDRFFDDDTAGRGLARDLLAALLGRGALPLGRIALAVAAFAGFLLVVRLLSMAWTAIQLHGFRLTRSGEDLSTAYGLLTRVVATIPLRRIQTLTVQEGPLHRLFGRVSVRVETAGGGGKEDGAKQREWLAPILRREALPGLVQEVLPGLDLDALVWRPPHPRAFRRELKGWLIVAVPIALAFVLLLGWWDLALLAALVALAYAAARGTIAHLAWALTGDDVLYRSGWLWRDTTVVRFARIQAVALRESPFDRRHAMARVHVDTAGAGDLSHHVDIPYLARETAHELSAFLAAQAAGTAFRW